MAQAHLTRQEIAEHDPEGGRGGRWLCPLPACADHTNPREHRNLSLEEDTGLWKCHRCGAGGKIKEKWKPFESRALRADCRASRARVRAALGKQHLAPSKQPLPVTEGLSRFRLGDLRRLADGPGAVYLTQDRGLPVELCHAAGVRYAPDFGRREATPDVRPWRGIAAVVFPVRNQSGKLVAAQGRAILTGAKPSKITIGPVSAGLFATPGAWDTDAPLAVVEAPIDALSLAACGFAAVATCGTRPLPDWAVLRLARSGRCVLLAHDADEPGEKAAAAVGDALRAGSLRLIRSFRLVPPGVKDWNDALRSLGSENLAAWLAGECRRLGAAPAANLPTLPPAGPAQEPHPSDGDDVPPHEPESPHGEILTGVAADAALRRLGLWDQLHPQVSIDDVGPLPDLALLDAHLTWPQYPADTPERVLRWAGRILVHMVARGDTRPSCARFAREYRFNLDGALTAAVRKQEKICADLAERACLSAQMSVQTMMEVD